MAVAVLSICALTKLVFYNPLAASTTDMLGYISTAPRERDTIVLTGTRQWAGPEPMKKTGRRYQTAL
eukprot:2912099-Pyramimonas_sp.AAC.1